MRAQWRFLVAVLGMSVLALLVGGAARAGVMEYGNENVLNSGATYPSDPKAGATLQYLAAGVVTDFYRHLPSATASRSTPTVGDFPGTRTRIYVGSVQTAAHEGYSGAASRLNGPQVLTLDYSSLVPAGQKIDTFTLGIASDDFQFPRVQGSPTLPPR